MEHTGSHGTPYSLFSLWLLIFAEIPKMSKSLISDLLFVMANIISLLQFLFEVPLPLN